MPIFIDQDRIVARPGQTAAATVWVLNDTRQSGVFTLRVRPADLNLGEDWYDLKIQPFAGATVPAGGRNAFTIAVTPRHSPDGATRLVEFVVDAVRAQVGAAVAPPPRPDRAPAAPVAAREQARVPAQQPVGAPAPVGGGAANPGFQQELFGAGAVAPAAHGFAEDELFGPGANGGAAPVTVAPPEPEPEPEPPRQEMFGLQDEQARERNVDIRDPNARIVDPNDDDDQDDQDDRGPAGNVGMLWTGSFFLFVPPVPEFNLELAPYGKKKASNAGPDASVEVYGRQKGDFAVQVTNLSQFPASFRLTGRSEVDGCQLHLDHQLLRVEPGKTENTVLTVRPNGPYWLIPFRSFGFRVHATPLTGAEVVNQVATIERKGAFRQLTEWLIWGLPLLLALVIFGSQRPSLRIERYSRNVLYEQIRLAELRDEGYIIDETTAREALQQMGVSGDRTARLEWNSNSRNVDLEYRRQGAKEWKAIPMEAEWLEKQVAQPSLPAGENENEINFELRMRARGWLPFVTDKWQVVPVVLGPRAQARMEMLDRDKRPIYRPAGRVIQADPRDRKMVFRLRNTNDPDNARGNFRRIRVWTKRTNSAFSLQSGFEDMTLNPVGPTGEPESWVYLSGSSGEQECTVTIVSNALEGNVRQVKLVGR